MSRLQSASASGSALKQEITRKWCSRSWRRPGSPTARQAGRNRNAAHRPRPRPAPGRGDAPRRLARSGATPRPRTTPRREHVGMGLADLAPGAQVLGRRLFEPQAGGARPRDIVRRALLLVQGGQRGLVADRADRGQKLTHCVEMVKRGARLHLARVMRGGVARIDCERDEAPRLPQPLVVPEQVAPVVEQGLCGAWTSSGPAAPPRAARLASRRQPSPWRSRMCFST